MSCMGLRVSLEVFQQSRLFAARSLGKDPVPRCKCGAQFASPRLQLSKPLFEDGKLFSRQLPNAIQGAPPLFRSLKMSANSVTENPIDSPARIIRIRARLFGEK